MNESETPWIDFMGRLQNYLKKRFLPDFGQVVQDVVFNNIEVGFDDGFQLLGVPCFKRLVNQGMVSFSPTSDIRDNNDGLPEFQRIIA